MSENFILQLQAKKKGFCEIGHINYKNCPLLEGGVNALQIVPFYQIVSINMLVTYLQKVMPVLSATSADTVQSSQVIQSQGQGAASGLQCLCPADLQAT